MTHAIVKKRGDQPLSQALQDEAQRLYAEVLSIEAAGDQNACRICGRCEALTDEHTPSKKAGNPMRAIQLSIDDDRTAQTGEVIWTNAFIQGGVATLSLCARCNNSTGRWYNPDYVVLAKYCARLAQPANAGKLCDVRLTVHPQRIMKQALATIVATSQPGLTEQYPVLRAMLLNAEKVSAVAPLRLSLFLDNDTIEGATDVSEWSASGFHDKLEINLKVPCQWVVSPYPADFRPPEVFPAGGSGSVRYTAACGLAEAPSIRLTRSPTLRCARNRGGCS